MKPLNFVSSVIFTILTLIAGAALAANVKSAEKSSLSRDQIQPLPIEKDRVENQLLVKVKGIRSSNGKLLVMVFDNAKSFASYDYEQAVGYQEVEVNSSEIVFKFASLAEGPYAVFVMHDENSDYVLNQTDGYPIEGFAVSGAKSPYDDPNFKQAAVVQGKHSLELVYF